MALEPLTTTFLLDPTGDIQFDVNGVALMATTPGAKIAQDLRAFLKTIRGEDMFNRSMGFNMIAARGDSFNANRIEYEIRQTVEQYRASNIGSGRVQDDYTITVGTPDAARNVAVAIEVKVVGGDTITIEVIV
ncbi:MAG: hypothetical protein KAJ03_11270 [Gammaproteobacteria bacterium]|nr:hypothetical protein [Gammaproteobacteria bacterium]